MALSFGPNWHSDFWASPFRLRFELRQGGSSINDFTSAYDRARTLARAALLSDQLIAVISAHSAPTEGAGARWRGLTKGTPLGLLEEMGVASGSALASWNGYWWPEEAMDDEAELTAQRAIRVSWDQADVLLWNQIALDRGVLPQAPVLSKLLDLDRGVLVNAYDDRGMDITALNKCSLMDLYERFDAWLLDYDRERMIEAFGG